MSMIKEIKICGLSTPADIDAVISGGATHMGMIFFEKSPRHVSLEKARELAEHTANRIAKVAVSVNADDDYLEQIVEATSPDMLQLHGSESPERVLQIKEHYRLPVMKAFAIRDKDDLEKTISYMPVVDRFLFDAKPPEGSELPGGNGVAFDWHILDDWTSPVPYMLSGRLDIDNVSEAVSLSGARAIDISSGVEKAPGEKDTALITAFLERCKTIDAQDK